LTNILLPYGNPHKQVNFLDKRVFSSGGRVKSPCLDIVNIGCRGGRGMREREVEET
jgi:hypothetical protein